VSAENLTLAEFSAFDVAWAAEPLKILNRVWDEIHAQNPFRGEAPTRLTDAGEAWLADVVERMCSWENWEAEAAAREFVKEMGLQTVTYAGRLARKEVAR